MIRLVQRQLIIPRGDTGTFSIPAIAKSEMGDASIFTIFDPLKHKKIFEKEMQLSDGVLSIDFTHGDTVNLPVGQFVWDIKFYKNVRKVDGLFVDGDEIDSYYAAFKLPVCEIRQTGDALLSADDAPTSTIAPEQLNVILAAGRQIHDAQVAVAADAAEVTEMKGLTEQMKDTAIEAADTATTAATSADASASAAQQNAASAADSMAQALTAQAAAEAAQSAAEASEASALLYKNAASASATAASQAAETATTKAAEAAASAESAANSVIEMQAAVAAIPTRVGEFENDVGYLVENDLASVAMSGDYGDLENKPFIPTRVSDLTDDSGHYIKPVTGIPASDLEETYLTSFTETDPTVPAWAKAAQKPTYTAQEVGALPANTHIPSTTQELTNDAGFITAAALPTKVSDLVDDSGHYTKPVTGIPASDLEETYVKFTDYATANNYGAVKFDPNYGITGFNNLGIPILAGANSDIIKAGEHGFRSIMPQRQHESVFYGLAKAAGANLANTENVVVGTYPDNAKTAIQQMLDVPSTSAVTSEIAVAIGNINSFDISVVQALPTENISNHTIYLVPKTGDTNDVYDEYVYVNNGWEMVGNTQIDLSNYVQKTDYATENKAGLAKFSATSGFIIGLNGGIFLDPANLTVIKTGTVTYQSITPYTQHAATFYGLAKAAGSDEKDSELPLGTYSTAAKSAIRSMLGAAASDDIPSVPVQDVQTNGISILSNGIANIPLGSNSTLGVFKYGNGLARTNDGTLVTWKADNAAIKLGTNQYDVIVPYNQYAAVFYGLAKAAGDSTQSSSDNAVGAYTDEAKAAINTMLGSVSKVSLDNAGITSKTYSVKFGGQFTVTTAENSDYISPYVRASVTGRISKHYKHRITFDGTEYILDTGLWFTSDRQKTYEYLGNLGLYVEDVSGVPQVIDNVPFVIISDLNDNSSIDVLTSVAGTHTIKVEQITPTQTKLPNSLLYGDEYAPIQKKNNGGTYNGFSIGVNELKATRGTIAFGYFNRINHEWGYAFGDNNTLDYGGITIGDRNQISDHTGYAFGYGNIISGANAIGIGNEVTANTTNMIALGSHNVPGVIINKTWASNTYYKRGEIVKAVWAPPGVSGGPELTWICKIAHTSGTYFMTDQQNGAYWDLSASNGDTLVVIGNGSNVANSNALKIDLVGNTYLGGNLYVNCNPDSTGGTLVPTDIQVNGTSVVSNGVANIPIMSDSNMGVAQRGSGLYLTNGVLNVNFGNAATIKTGTAATAIASIARGGEVVFYGLSKAAGVDLANETVTLGTYPETSKTAIRSMIGAISNIDYASRDTAGVVKFQEEFGVNIGTNSKCAFVVTADLDLVKGGTNYYRPVTPAHEHEAAFYGLAKAAGDTTQAASSNAVGTYTDEAKSAIQTMLGIPKDVRINGSTVINNSGIADIPIAISSDVKTGSSTTRPLTPNYQHHSTFYGLAKAAGDTTMTSSSNAVGTYTPEAKTAIRTMLGVDPASIAAEVDIPLIETVTGTTPIIVGQPNVRYVCGEVSTITITPPSSGSVDVIFESGSTPAVMTVPNTVKWPAWFDATTLDTGTTYEILITDGVYGSVMTWAT